MSMYKLLVIDAINVNVTHMNFHFLELIYLH